MQWLRDGLKLIDSASAIEQLALSVDDSEGVYFVPALTVLVRHTGIRMRVVSFAASPEARQLALLERLSKDRYQNLDILNAMASDAGHSLKN